MNISKTILSIIALAVAYPTAGPAFAHHSFAMFDTKQDVKLEGTVKEFQWTNPHCWLQVLVKDPATGKEQELSIEGGSPNGLARQGWSRTSAKAGDKVVVVVHPLKSGAPGGSLVTMEVNGQMVGR